MNRIVCIRECMMELSDKPDKSLVHEFGVDRQNSTLYVASIGAQVK